MVALALGCATGPVAEFAEHAAPVLERSCASERCHGVTFPEPLPEAGFFVAIDSRGRLVDLDAARARSLERVTTTAPSHLSSLVRVPLAAAHEGGPHVGGDLFASPSDPSARELGRWIDSEPEGSGGEDVVFTELEARFARDVLPVLVQRCGFAGCHGRTEVSNSVLSARTDPSTGAFAPLDVRRTRRAVRKFIELTGAEVTRSRLLRKAIGASAGGLLHRGGPGTFFPEAAAGDPLATREVLAILGWARAERAALGIAERPAPRGVVYVRQPVSARSPYRIEPELEGSDLFFVAWPPGTGTPENLTGALHPEGPVEIREPAVAHDGHTIAFAMRRATERTFAIFELDLDTRETRRLTAADAAGSFVSPVYGPDGRLVAVWDGHGEAGTDGPGIPPELVVVEPDGLVERLTWTRAPEVRPSVLSSGKTRGMIGFGIRRGGPRGAEGVLFRFPPCHDPALHGEPEYHVHFGASLAPLAPLVARDLPDGRQILIVLGSTGDGDDRGRLAILDRSLGPPLPEGAPPSVAGLLDPISTLDATPTWRDPVPLPDGRVLASTDLGRGAGEDALVFLNIVDGPAGATLGTVEAWLAEPAMALRSAAVVAPRPLEDDGHVAIVDGERIDARIAIRDAAVLEAIYGRTEPYGARPIRTDLRAVRLLVPARTEGVFDAPGARVLAEIPLAADRSAEIRIPARTPILLSWLDANGMVVGNQLDRWFYGEGGEVVPAGTNQATYAHACATCHGSLSGLPDASVRPAPDVLSAASVTLSTHDGRDRRLPIAPADAMASEPEDPAFEASVEPILEERCVPCHGGASPAAGLSLERGPGERFGAAYESLMFGGFVDPSLRARRSPLVERLSGRELDALGTPAGRCPPEGLSADELQRFCRWIESGAAYRELADAP